MGKGVVLPETWKATHDLHGPVDSVVKHHSDGGHWTPSWTGQSGGPQVAGPGVSQGWGRLGREGSGPGNWWLGEEDEGRAAEEAGRPVPVEGTVCWKVPRGRRYQGQSRFAGKVRSPRLALSLLESELGKGREEPPSSKYFMHT